MENLKQLRERIKSVKATAKLTKAMKMVAASRLTKIKRDLNNSQLYIDNISSIISNINFEELDSDIDYKENSIKKYLGKGDEGIALLILCSSDKGLCGGFNMGIVKKLKQDILSFQSKQKKVKIIVVGRKGNNLLNNELRELVAEYIDIHQLSREDIFLKIKSAVDNMLAHNIIYECSIYFNLFKNTMVQVPTKRLLLPLNKIIKNVGAGFKNYEYEGTNLTETIVKLHIEGEIRFALVQSSVSEEGARLTAMDSATNNANGLVNNLTLKLNKTRQANITSELTEIISGVEAI